MPTPPTVDLDALAERVRREVQGKLNGSFSDPEVAVSDNGYDAIIVVSRGYQCGNGWASALDLRGRVWHNGPVTSAALAALRVLVGDEGGSDEADHGSRRGL